MHAAPLYVEQFNRLWDQKDGNDKVISKVCFWVKVGCWSVHKNWNQLDLFKIEFVRSTIVDDIVPPLLSDLCPSWIKQPWVLSIPCAMSIFMDMHVCSDVSIGHTHLSIWLQHDTKYSTVQRSWASPVNECKGERCSCNVFKGVLITFSKSSKFFFGLWLLFHSLSAQSLYDVWLWKCENCY